MNKVQAQRTVKPPVLSGLTCTRKKFPGRRKNDMVPPGSFQCSLMVLTGTSSGTTLQRLSLPGIPALTGVIFPGPNTAWIVSAYLVGRKSSTDPKDYYAARFAVFTSNSADNTVDTRPSNGMNLGPLEAPSGTNFQATMSFAHVTLFPNSFSVIVFPKNATGNINWACTLFITQVKGF